MPLPLLKRWPPLLRHTGGDFEVSRRDKGPLQKLLILSLSDDAQSTVFVERPEASKTHLATALGISGLTRHGKRVRFYFTVELVTVASRQPAKELPWKPLTPCLPSPCATSQNCP